MFIRKASLILIALGFCFYSSYSQAPAEIKTKTDSVSYSIGYNIGTNLVMQFSNDTIPFTIPAVMEGVKDGLNKNTKTRLTQEQMQTLLMVVQQDIMTKREAQRAKMEAEKKVAGEANKAAGEKFLAENKTKPGVQTTASGLQYKVEKMGTGKKPTTNNEVKVHYKGTLIGGKVFDSSIDRGEPVTFPVTGVIKGWTEALQLMPEGSKWTLYIPAELAYGDRSVGQDIGPNQTLIFDVELLQVIDKPAGDQIKVAPVKPDTKKK